MSPRNISYVKTYQKRTESRNDSNVVRQIISHPSPLFFSENLQNKAETSNLVASM
ncbi:Hypothetical protein OINT_1002393 [Brucella intermedia LMG 3301]|uniref:Uncharacterized protein n=1 Tax=Brucella intermedia LMG 3301 TaxID=641118 RepID=C4WKI2_9HYPH|nr:Hypothetical protein OINT_1002393 [Brucella intermedia LMG 3301]